jgi:hypothetical protein
MWLYTVLFKAFADGNDWGFFNVAPYMNVFIPYLTARGHGGQSYRYLVPTGHADIPIIEYVSLGATRYEALKYRIFYRRILHWKAP